MKIANKYYKILLGLAELVLAIPVLGALIVFSTVWHVLGFMIVLHIVGIVLSIFTKQKLSGHVFGVFANCIAIIPIVGMIVHGITGLILLYQGFTVKTQSITSDIH